MGKCDMNHSSVSRSLRRAFLGVLLSLASCNAPETAPEASDASWRMDSVPALVVGGESSGPTSDIYNVVGTVRLSDGRIVIADGAPRLLVVDSTGTYLETWGGPGDGPGEFRRIRWIQLVPGDSIVVYDPQMARVHFFTGDGEHASQPDITRPRRALVGRSQDGSWVSRRFATQSPSVREDGVTPPRDVMVLSHESDGSGEQLLGTLEGGEEILLPNGSLYFGLHPLRELRIAVGPHEVYATSGRRFEIQVYDLDGGPSRVLSWESPLVPLTPQIMADAIVAIGRSVRVEDIPPFREDQTLPAISGLVVDREGNVWAEAYDPELENPRTWSVFEPTGQLLAEVIMAPRFRPYDIGADFVLGVIRDQLDVERIHLYRLGKP